MHRLTPELEALHKAAGDTVVNGRVQNSAPAKAMLDNDNATELNAELVELSKTATSFEDIPEELIVRAMLNMLTTNKRPAVQRQVLRDLAEMKGMLKKRATANEGGVQAALDRLK